MTPICSRRSVAAFLGLASLLVTACSEGSAPQSEALPVWSLGEPEVELGSLDDGPEAFSLVRDVTLGPGSELHILLPQEHQVRVFTWSGEFVRVIGAEGDGPGEFRRPSRVGFMGDTLWVLDDGSGRASFFLDGVLQRVDPYPALDGLHEERLGSVTAVVAESALLVATDRRSPFDPKVASNPGALLRYADGEFQPLATIGVDHLGGFMIKGTLPDKIEAVSIFRQPFSAASLWGVSRNGTRITVVDRIEGAPGRAPAYSVLNLTASGDTLSGLTVSYDPIPVPDALVDSLLSPYVDHNFSLSDVREAAYLPETFPPVSAMVLGADGTAWLAREQIPEVGREWDVVSAEGNLIASLRSPLGFTIRLVTESDVWGLVTDELDVPYLVRRPIVRD